MVRGEVEWKCVEVGEVEKKMVEGGEVEILSGGELKENVWMKMEA